MLLLAVSVRMELSAAEPFLALFEAHPFLAVLAGVASLVGWAIKTDALGFVARKNRSRRADVFDSYEKLKAMGALTDDDLDSLKANLRDASVGLSVRNEPAERESEPSEQKRGLPPAAEAASRVADGIVNSLGYALAAALYVGMLVFTFGLLWMALVSKDPNLIFAGAIIGPTALFTCVKITGDLLRKVAVRVPVQYHGLSQSLRWIGALSERIEVVLLIGVVVIAYLMLLVIGVLITAHFSTTATSWLEWTGAVVSGLVTAALAVRMGVDALVRVGIFGRSEAPEDAEG